MKYLSVRENIPEPVRTRYRKLQEILAAFESVLVAFSGGVDSTLLLRVAVGTLPDRVRALYVSSPLNPDRDRESAKRLAGDLGVPWETIDYALVDSNLVRNDRNRCYWCKRGIYSQLLDRARTLGISTVVEGSNTDDLADYRPGWRAVQELGIESPLVVSGFSKKDVRSLSRCFGLPTWDQPAQSCLATRIPYGTPLTPDILRQVAAAEEVLWAEGLRGFRIRHHGEVARIELNRDDFPSVLDQSWRQSIGERIRQTGYRYVTVDLAGYRPGSLNDVLTQPAQETMP